MNETPVKEKSVTEKSLKRPRRGLTRNLEGLKASAERKAATSRGKVLEAIDRLLAEGQAVNFRSVQKAAGVSRGYLYSNAELRTRIEKHRASGSVLRLVSGPVKEVSRTDRSKDMLLLAKDMRIKQLESELSKLKVENKKLHGRLYEAIAGKG